MEERISQLLKGKQFFDFGEIVFASNHPDHVYLIEVKNKNDELFTVIYDQKHDHLNINKLIDPRTIKRGEKPNIKDTNIKLSSDQRQEIIKLLIESKNNIEE